MRVDIEILRATIHRLLDHAKEVNGDTVEVSDDLYWFVPRKSLHVPENEPAGSLSARYMTIGPKSQPLALAKKSLAVMHSYGHQRCFEALAKKRHDPTVSAPTDSSNE